MKLRKPRIAIGKKGVSLRNVGVRLGGKKAGVNLSRKGASVGGNVGGVGYNSKRGCVLPFFGILIVVILFLLLSVQLVFAASSNLLKGHNPSFEQGITDWEWNVEPDFFIKSRRATPTSCGNHFLRITQGDAHHILASHRIRVREDGRYKFTIRARVQRGPGQNAFVSDIWAWMVQHNGSGALYSIARDIKSTNGKWVEYSGTFQSDKEHHPRMGFFIEFQITKGGKIDFDCARIERVS